MLRGHTELVRKTRGSQDLSPESSPPAESNVVVAKWVYQWQTNDQVKVTKGNAASVAKRYSQVEGIDCPQTFAHNPWLRLSD